MISVEYVIVEVGIAVAEVPEPEVETVLPLYIEFYECVIKEQRY